MSLTLYLFYMVLFVGLFAWGVFLWIVRRDDEEPEEPEEERGKR
jgi:hypothetical protein